MSLAAPAGGEWAYWLSDALPNVVRLVAVPSAKLVFPEDRPEALTEPPRAFLAAEPR